MQLDVLSIVKQLIQDGRHHAAVAECDKALDGDLSNHERSAIMRHKAQALVATDGRWTGPAMHCLKLAHDLTTPGSEERGCVLAAFTAAYADLGCLGPCRRAREAFVELYRTNPTPLLKKLCPDVEYNVAIGYHEVERLDESETAYMTALAATNGIDDPYVVSLRPIIYHNLVDIFQENDRWEHAQAIIDGAYRGLPDEEYGAQTRNRRAAQALHDGDPTSALLWVESGLGHKSCDTRTRAALMLTKAKILADMGQIDDAHDCALEASRLAVLARSNRLNHRASSFIQHLSEGV